jgi:hypothetical protein
VAYRALNKRKHQATKESRGRRSEVSGYHSPRPYRSGWRGQTEALAWETEWAHKRSEHGDLVASEAK